MRRIAVPPTPLEAFPEVRTPQGTLRRVIVDEPAGPKTLVLTYPPGTRSRFADRGFEYHSCHEEIFLLDGYLQFGDWYDWSALGYINHPPYWVHPADQRTAVGATMLVKIDGPVDFGFEPIPPNWDGREYFAAAAPTISRARPVRNVMLNDIPWERVSLPDGRDMGFEAKHLYDDPESGWTTWLMRAPAGWRTQGGRIREGGEEIFLLEGDLTIEGVGRLVGRSYYCDPDKTITGKWTERGCVAIRWTRGGDYVLPPIRF
ncbi:MAG: hypothetical protein RMM58_00665 [Chloroflexota bacterium]|nr:DUF4437 domain-containing protein [Dehalococcoidia bacterium]MDW8252370.1 hypothetical protein [Chloroflexota bacterium]